MEVGPAFPRRAGVADDCYTPISRAQLVDCSACVRAPWKTTRPSTRYTKRAARATVCCCSTADAAIVADAPQHPA
jgi:hypothetical protein